MLLGIFLLSILCWGYIFYSKRVEKNFGVNKYNPIKNKGENIPYIQYRWLQIAQFGLISSIECLFGAVIGITHGIVTMIWCVLGSIFIGGCLNYYCGMYSLTHRGKNINNYSEKIFGKTTYYITSILIMLFLVIGIGTICVYLMNINFYTFSIPKIGYIYFMGIVFIAILPLKYFTYCCIGNALIFIVSSLIFALLSINNIINSSIFTNTDFNNLKYVYPSLFFIVNAGVLSGIQGLQSGLISGYVKNEKMGREIFYGATIIQAGFVILWSILLISWEPSYKAILSLIQKSHSPYLVVESLIMLKYGIVGELLLYLTAISLCILSASSLFRILLQMAKDIKLIKSQNNIGAILTIIILSFLSFEYYFGMKYYAFFNQIISAYLFLLISIFLKKKHKKYSLELYFSISLIFMCIAYALVVFANQPHLNAIIIGIVSTILFILIHYIYFSHKKLR